MGTMKTTGFDIGADRAVSTFRRIMKVPGARFLLWNMPDHLRRTSMSSKSRSSHLVSPFLLQAVHTLSDNTPRTQVKNLITPEKQRGYKRWSKNHRTNLQ